MVSVVQISSAIRVYDEESKFIVNVMGQIFNGNESFQVKKDRMKEVMEKYIDNPLPYYYMGYLYQSVNMIQESLTFYNLSTCVGNFMDAYLNIATIYQKMGKMQISEYYLQVAYKKNDKDSRIINYLGTIYHLDGNYKKALEYYFKAVNTCDDKQLLKGLYNNIGFIYSGMGQEGEAIKYFNLGLDINIAKDSYTEEVNKLNIQILQNKLLCFDYINNPPADSYKVYLMINKFYSNVQQKYHFEPLDKFEENCKKSTRKLRIGYVSPNLRRHAVSFFLESILKNYNKDKFEVYCYNNSASIDDVTKRLQGYVDGWHDIVPLTDDQASELIFSHKIDILIDLVGHTNDNRLGIFARRPAPIQMTYLGYPNTTGLKQMDYRITDKYSDPKNSKQFYSEKLVRMPKCFINYLSPYNENQLPLNEQTIKVHSPIVIGVMNKFHKHSNDCIKLWKQILEKVPTAKFFLKREIVTDWELEQKYLEKLNITKDRLIIADYQKDGLEHWKQYYNVDICLDTFPYSGTTTTCNSLWMGLPVVTYYKKNQHVHNVSTSILTNVGYPELIAKSEEEYVDIVVKLANDPARILEYKKTIRQKFIKSMDDKTFAKEFGELLLNVYKTESHKP